MSKGIKDATLEAIRLESQRKMGQLAKQLVRADSEDKEEILAGLEMERWLEQSCRECLHPPGKT